MKINTMDIYFLRTKRSDNMKCDVCKRILDKKHDNYIRHHMKIPTSYSTNDDIILDVFCPMCYRKVLANNNELKKLINDI